MRPFITKTVLTLFAVCLLLMQPAVAQNQSSLSTQDRQFGEWMTYYYVNKDPAKISEYLKWLQTSQILEKNDGAWPPIAGFLSVVFADNQDQVKSWVQNAHLTGRRTKATLAYALWWSNNSTVIGDIFGTVPDVLKKLPVDIKTMPLKIPSDFSTMWGAFSASGDVTYVKRLIDVLEGQALTGNHKTDAALRGVVEWALGSNMWQHELVRRLVYQQEMARTGAVKSSLDTMIKNYEKRVTSFTNKDGDFSAMLAITGEEALSQFEKPTDQGIELKDLAKVKPDQKFLINVMFMGMALADDLNADVTFDLKITAPDGTLFFKDANMKDIEALKRKVPMRYKIFDNKNYVKIAFGANDKPGKYSIAATVKDNVGRKKVELVKEIELVR